VLSATFRVLTCIVPRATGSRAPCPRAVCSCSRAGALLLASLLGLSWTIAVRAQTLDSVPIGVRYQLDSDAARRQRDLDEFRRLRFNVVALGQEAKPSDELELGLIDRLLAGAADTRVRMGGIAILSAQEIASGPQVKQAAWYYFGMGARGIIFGDWAALQQNGDALTAAVEFAEHVSRNAALYAPLQPRVPKTDPPDVTIEGNDPRISARFLESSDALLLIVTNHDASETREVTLTFSPEMPEAIWQNMLAGTAVNFVAGPKGPVYTRTFPPKDVLVLMIRKKLK
jgi:hypothetical protein